MNNKLLNLMLLLVFILCTASCSGADQGLFFDADGINIYYKDSMGEGVPVVLIHGYTMDSSMWYEAGIAQELAKNYRVIVVDLRGHGKSDKPTTPQDYGPKVGLDVIKLMDHLKIPKAHLVGYSMGAFVIGRLLVTHPDRVVSAVLGSGSFPMADKAEREFQELTAKDMEAHGEMSLASVARGWALDAVTSEQIEHITTPIQAVFGSEEIDDFYHRQKELLEQPKSSFPVLIIAGADHDSHKAAVLHPDFLKAVRNLIESVAVN